MAQVEVKDRAIWIGHIHGDPQLATRLAALGPGQTVRLRVDGKPGVWSKMRDTEPRNAKRRPTPGLKPVAEIKDYWRRLFETRRGELVEISFDDGGEGGAKGWITAPNAEREAAWAAFKALTGAGWCSEAPYGDRDELHDR